ncbi:MAG: hypothetical protein HY905_00165 [Deltaproteobacteria bacterium]|nr:hypothetical protein [Deltaproteobacteria bacterium]
MAACWGTIATGALGNLSGLTHVVAIAVSGWDRSHESVYITRSCAVLPDGSVWCWGFDSGEVPVQVAAW